MCHEQPSDLLPSMWVEDEAGISSSRSLSIVQDLTLLQLCMVLKARDRKPRDAVSIFIITRHHINIMHQDIWSPQIPDQSSCESRKRWSNVQHRHKWWPSGKIQQQILMNHHVKAAVFLLSRAMTYSIDHTLLIWCQKDHKPTAQLVALGKMSLKLWWSRQRAVVFVMLGSLMVKKKNRGPSCCDTEAWCRRHFPAHHIQAGIWTIWAFSCTVNHLSSLTHLVRAGGTITCLQCCWQLDRTRERWSIDTIVQFGLVRMHFLKYCTMLSGFKHRCPYPSDLPFYPVVASTIKSAWSSGLCWTNTCCWSCLYVIGKS